MKFPSAYAVLLLPALALCVAAQEAPRLDGSNVPQPQATHAPSTPAAIQPLTPVTKSAAPAVSPNASRRSSRKAKASPATPIVPVTLVSPPPPTPADLPPQAATIQFYGGLLTVHATNASLAQILRDTSVQTGMQIEGTPEDQRIFGDFGPAPVAVVLGQLLDGGPSNYVLFGRNSNMSPRTLVISPKSSLAPGQVAGVSPKAATVNNEDADDEDDGAAAQPQPIRPFHGNGMNQDQQGGGGGAPRTPQQIIDDLQRRRQEQQIQPMPPPTPPDANTQ